MIVSTISIKTFHQFLWQFASFDMCPKSASVFERLFQSFPLIDSILWCIKSKDPND